LAALLDVPMDQVIMAGLPPAKAIDASDRISRSALEQMRLQIEPYALVVVDE
jgi:hypothetical protein